MIFKDIKRGDRFRVDERAGFCDEWFYRGTWIKTAHSTGKGTLCVCLTQGNNNEGDTMEWRDDIPVVLVQERHPCSRKEEHEE